MRSADAEWIALLSGPWAGSLHRRRPLHSAFRIPHSALGVGEAVRVVLQRVSRAAVLVEGRVTGSIGVGFLVLAGFAPSDTEDQLAWMADKGLGLRLFGDAEGKMKLALAEVGGALLVGSQCTPDGDAPQGGRPS